MTLETINGNSRVDMTTTTEMLPRFDTWVITRRVFSDMTVNARLQTMFGGTHAAMHGVITMMFEIVTMIAAYIINWLDTWLLGRKRFFGFGRFWYRHTPTACRFSGTDG